MPPLWPTLIRPVASRRCGRLASLDPDPIHLSKGSRPMAQRSKTTPQPNMTPAAIISRLRLDPVTFVSELARPHGDIVEMPLGSQSLFLLSSPAYIKEIFTNSNVFKKRPDAAAEESYLGQISGITPRPGRASRPAYAPAMVEASERAHARCHNARASPGGGEFDMYRDMVRSPL